MGGAPGLPAGGKVLLANALFEEWKPFCVLFPSDLLQRRDGRKLCISCPLPASEASSTVFQGSPCVFQGPHSNVPLRTSDVPQGPMTWQHRNIGGGGAPSPPQPQLSVILTPSCWTGVGACGCFLPGCKVPGKLPAPLPQKRLPAGPRGGVPEQLYPSCAAGPRWGRGIPIPIPPVSILEP